MSAKWRHILVVASAMFLLTTLVSGAAFSAYFVYRHGWRVGLEEGGFAGLLTGVLLAVWTIFIEVDSRPCPSCGFFLQPKFQPRAGRPCPKCGWEPRGDDAAGRD